MLVDVVASMARNLDTEVMTGVVIWRCTRIGGVHTSEVYVF